MVMHCSKSSSKSTRSRCRSSPGPRRQSAFSGCPPSSTTHSPITNGWSVHFSKRSTELEHFVQKPTGRGEKEFARDEKNLVRNPFDHDPRSLHLRLQEE